MALFLKRVRISAKTYLEALNFKQKFTPLVWSKLVINSINRKEIKFLFQPW